MSLLANRFGRVKHLFLFFQVRLPEENNNKYLRFQIDELPKTIGRKVTKKNLFCVTGTYSIYEKYHQLRTTGFAQIIFFESL